VLLIREAELLKRIGRWFAAPLATDHARPIGHRSTGLGSCGYESHLTAIERARYDAFHEVSGTLSDDAPLWRYMDLPKLL
jgi:hypothetical protein